MKRLYAVFDKKAKAYGPMMSYAHEAQAVRDFGGACTSGESQLSRFPEDFELHSIGVFHDVESGTLVVQGTSPEVVVTASAVIAAQQPVGEPKLVKEA